MCRVLSQGSNGAEKGLGYERREATRLRVRACFGAWQINAMGCALRPAAHNIGK